MRTPVIPWVEGRSWPQAVRLALPAELVSPFLAVPPMLALATAFLCEGWLRVLAVAVLVLTSGGAVALAVRASKGSRYREAKAKQAEAMGSAPMRATHEGWPLACDARRWCRDHAEVVSEPTGKTDENGQPVMREVQHTRRERPAMELWSEDPANEVRLVIDTTSALVSFDEATRDASLLASHLGFNGWPVEVHPAARHGAIEISISRHATGDLYSRYSGLR